MQLNSDQIRQILPHRSPFLMIDRVDDYEPGKWARGVKCVSAGEPYFAGHFPESSIMPGVLILEALAQTGAIAILTEPECAGKIAVLGAVRNARFLKRVVPGDVITLECRITRQRGPIGIGESTALVDGEIVCSADFTFAVTD